MCSNSEKIFLRKLEKDEKFDLGILMLKIKKNLFFINYNKNLRIEETNFLCSQLGYVSMHSISSAIKLNQSYINFNLHFKQKTCCQL